VNRDAPYWRDHAACRLEDSTLFDPPEGRFDAEQIKAQLLHARMICLPCPVKDACVAAAIVNEDSGVRGGLYFDDGQPAADPRPGGRPRHVRGVA